MCKRCELNSNSSLPTLACNVLTCLRISAGMYPCQFWAHYLHVRGEMFDLRRKSTVPRPEMNHMLYCTVPHSGILYVRNLPYKISQDLSQKALSVFWGLKGSHREVPMSFMTSLASMDHSAKSAVETAGSSWTVAFVEYAHAWYYAHVLSRPRDKRNMLCRL